MALNIEISHRRRVNWTLIMATGSDGSPRRCLRARDRWVAVIRPAVAGVVAKRLHRHRRTRHDLTSRDDDGGYFVRRPGLRLRANTVLRSTGEAESQESCWRHDSSRRWLAPPVAYPGTTQEIKPVDDANDERRRE